MRSMICPRIPSRAFSHEEAWEVRKPTRRFSAIAALFAWAAGVFVWTVVAVAQPPQVPPGAESQGTRARHPDPLPEGEGAHTTPHPSPVLEGAGVQWLIASEDQPWTVALAAAVAAHLGRSGPSPLLMTVSSPPTREADWLLSLAAGQRPIVLASADRLHLGDTLQNRSPELLRIGCRPSEASAIVAKRFWKQSREVVVASADDAEAVILGSALAAGLDVPILLCGQEGAGAAVSAALKDLSVARMLVAVSDDKKPPRWIQQQEVASQILSPKMLQHRLIAALGADKIRNVVVARAPDDRADVGHTAWLAPYASSARGAAVVLTHAHGAAVAEADVRELIRRESLQPQTVTILADYASIAYRCVEIDPNSGEEGPEEPPVVTPQPALSCGTAAAGTAAAGTVTSGTAGAPAPPRPYKVRTEPFVPIQPDVLATLGVGRIPLDSLGDASVFFVRGLLRERLLAHRPPRLLMVSNSGLNRRTLPLCEAISRVTTAEFKNFGIHVDEFYGRVTDSPEILTTARSANLILYEGHLSYQDLIDEPVLKRSQAEDYPLDEEEVEGPGGAKRALDRGADPRPAQRVVMAEPTSRHMQGPLAGLPIVVLQSCESLDDAVLWRLDELGGTALIGSMTPIHSGCGSAMLNAAMGSLLYRGGTLGETLRDAENYMFCVEELKARRGHKEKAKGVRVALSFRLWGDPELKVLPNRPGPGLPGTGPRQAPIRAEWVGDDTLRIDLPPSRLPEARSERYVANVFPNSQVAGLMKTEGEITRKLSPFYYFRLPLPESLAYGDVTSLEPSRSDAKRVYARIDQSHGLLYLVYYPDQENPGESVVLRLKAATRRTGCPAATQARRPSK